MSEDFAPTEIALVPSQDQTLLVARASDARYVGVVCPPELVSTLRSFISPSNTSLIEFWHSYAKAKGDGTFFWDVISIAEGIRDLSNVPRSRRLLHFTSESDLFHNSWQARLMRLCIKRGLSVEMVPAVAGSRQPDFLAAGVALEIKTLFSESGVEIDDGRIRLAPPDADRLARTIPMKVYDALGQAGQDGLIVVALWCDLAANAICRLGETKPLDAIELSPGTVVLALRPSEGDEAHMAMTVPIGDIEPFSQRLSERLRAFTEPTFIPFSGRHVCVISGNANEWMSMGRVVQIGEWSTRYAPYETPRSVPTSDIPDDLRAFIGPRLASARAAMQSWGEMVKMNPIEPRPYSSSELVNDPRFAALFAWGAPLFQLVSVLRQRDDLTAVLLPEGRPRDDANRYFEAVFLEDGRLNTDGFLALHRGVECMTRLTNHLVASLNVVTNSG